MVSTSISVSSSIELLQELGKGERGKVKGFLFSLTPSPLTFSPTSARSLILGCSSILGHELDSIGIIFTDSGTESSAMKCCLIADNSSSVG
ncbi:hypothetical protein DP117_31955 [Brasilonema sp. UFV-L1]|nr:hypothetical protein [Brasilonema sp. UFV-L1]